MTGSRVELFRALLAKHEDEGIGLEAKRQHTYRWPEADGREKRASEPTREPQRTA